MGCTETTLELHWNATGWIHWNYTGITLKCHWMGQTETTLEIHWMGYTEIPLHLQCTRNAPPVYPNCTSYHLNCTSQHHNFYKSMFNHKNKVHLSTPQKCTPGWVRCAPPSTSAKQGPYPPELLCFTGTATIIWRTRPKIWVKDSHEFSKFTSFLKMKIRCTVLHNNNANLRDLIATTGLVILLKLGFKSSIFRPVLPWNLMNDLKKQ